MTPTHNDQVCARVQGKDITRTQLSAAFDRVKDSAHWKNPIRSNIVLDDDFEKEVMSEAIIFFTGSVPKFTLRTPVEAKVYRVEATGYYMAIGA